MDDHGVENISNLPISCCSTVSGEDDVLDGKKMAGIDSLYLHQHGQLLFIPCKMVPYKTAHEHNLRKDRVKVPSFGFCDVKVSQTWVGLPNQMISLILMFGFLCRYPDDREI